MADLIDETKEILRDIVVQAQDVTDELRRRKDEAYQDHDYEAHDRYAAALIDAINAEDAAMRRLIAGILAPEGETVVSLKDATAELKQRIEKFKQDAKALASLASALTIVTQLVLLVAML